MEGRTAQQYPVRIPCDDKVLDGDLVLPQSAPGIVLFAHGSGSSRFSPRNRFVARTLNEARLATLLFDLLTQEEEALDAGTGELRFNIDMLAVRLVAVTDWVSRQDIGSKLSIGYFGASTGAAAALAAAAKRPDIIRAVVSRGGRPDLAKTALRRVRAPTLLIVGGLDITVIELNRQAFHEIRAEKEMVIVPGASHLFGEPGTLEKVARLAADWFTKYLVPRRK